MGAAVDKNHQIFYFFNKNCQFQAKSGSGAGELDDLFVCIGDILPTFERRFPNRGIAVYIYALYAPLVTLYSREGSSGIDIIFEAGEPGLPGREEGGGGDHPDQHDNRKL